MLPTVCDLTSPPSTGLFARKWHVLHVIMRRTMPQPAQPVHQHAGEGGEVQAQLIGPQRGAAGAIGEQTQLLLFVPVEVNSPSTNILG